MAQKILIIDSSSMIAMRLKVLLELIGCEVELVHYSMFDQSSNIDAYDMLAFSQGTPTTLVASLVNQATHQ